MSMNTPIGNITQTTPIKNFKELDEMQNEQYLLGIDNNAIGNGSKISLENLINSSISTDSDNLITKGTDDRLLVNTPIEIGDLSDLTTTNKSTLVAAINEVDGDITAEATTRQNADNNLQSQIDAITAASDVTDIVGTYAELQAYDTTGLPDNSIVKVLQDESRQDETTYYRWVITGGVGAWVLIGEEGPYYTKSQSDSKFATQATVGNLNNLATSDKSSVVNAMNELASVLDPTQTADYIKNSKAIYSGEVSKNALILPQIKEMAHSTFDLSKFTVVGSPTITNDGIVSGFSSSNYLTIPLIDSSKNFEIDICIKTGNSIPSTNAYIFGYVSGGYGDGLRWYSNGKLVWGIHDTNGGLHNVEFANFSVNTEYWIKLKHIDDKNYLCVSEDGVNYTENSTTSNSYTIANYFRIGVSGTTTPSDAWSGSIDLKQFSITVDGVEVFSGNRTGIDTIKSDDYTVVGTPTISEDGIASGFSSSSYINGATGIILGNNFEITVKFATGSNITDYQGIFRLQNGTTYIGSLVSYAGQDTLTANFSDGVNKMEHAAILSMTANTTYYVKLKLVNGVCTYSYSTDNINWTNTYSGASSVNITNANTVLYIGNNTTDLFWSGSIDLNTFKIYIDGNLVYQPCLKIPYTESKTGSKIVDSVYRSRVCDMEEQFGYALYYTMQEDNRPQYTVVGSTTISSDYVASGFSSSNYLNAVTFNPNTSKWKIEGSFTTPSTLTNTSQKIFGSTLIYDGVNFGTYNNVIQLSISNNGTSMNIADENSSLTISPNTLYYYEVLFDGANYKVNLSTDGENWTNYISKASSLTINAFTMQVGAFRNGIAPFAGSIDLKSFKIYVDNKLAYEAVTDPNFALPQGEIYGMIGINKNDIAELESNKLDKDGSNAANLSETFLAQLMPDYSNGITISSFPYTAPANGFIDVGLAALEGTAQLYVNNIKIGHAYSSSNNFYSMISGQYRVKTGDVITYTGAILQYAEFFPYV